MIGSAPKADAVPKAAVRIAVDLQPREGPLSEINVIGCTVEQAVDRVAKSSTTRW